MRFRVLGYGPWAKVILNHIRKDGLVDAVLTKSIHSNSQWNNITSENLFLQNSGNFNYFLCANQQTNKLYLENRVIQKEVLVKVIKH